MAIKLNLGTLLLFVALSIFVVYMGVENANPDAEFPILESYSSAPMPDFDPKNEEEQEWNFGGHKNQQKWLNQMEQRGWTKEEITETIKTGERFPATNRVTPTNEATRFLHPTSGKSVIVDNVTKELLHIGKVGFGY